MAVQRMGNRQSGWRPTRRLLLGAAVVGGAVLWGGNTIARLMRSPSSAKDAGRIADVDGHALPLQPLENAPSHDAGLTWLTKGGTVNDASGLSRTPIYGMVEVGSEKDVAEALSFARANGLKVSMAAVRHSMGGHAFDDNAVVLDMRNFNAVSVDATAKTMTVQPGATWHDIQNILHPRFAVKAMQSTDIFSVGGSLSVNAHGMDHQAGSVAGSIRSLRVMLADGSVLRCSASENADLFRHVVGGYGLFGVVLEATLDIVDNAVYRTSREIIKSEEFPRFFSEVAGTKPRDRPVLRPSVDGTGKLPRRHDRLSLRKSGRATARRSTTDRRARCGRCQAPDHEPGEMGCAVPGSEMVHRKDSGAAL
ncbi:FAD-dependent oxidoreductase [Mesorhizobium sp. UC22_110]|uniref:FAD-binding oxidoreductase n=1 Tax=Mesorhizobium sp. UC22_110 TaxID=3374552 RepID=UPI0037580245